MNILDRDYLAKQSADDNSFLESASLKHAMSLGEIIGLSIMH